MFRSICATILLLMVIPGEPSAEIYLWPMHGQRRISSSFSEYRDGHYHAGVDLRSYGALGLPCLAVSDGYVSRIKIAPYGYGKALYLRLDDGVTAVYAHLDCFAYSVDSLIWHYRTGREVSWCDIELPEGRYRFSVGDTVCFQGETGTSAPHLHFELRDESQRPFNPIERIYTLPDRAAPIISALEAHPLAEGSLVNGDPFPRIFLMKASGRNHYELADTLHISGSLGLAVSTWDEQGYGRYALAPASVEFTVDGDTAYHLKNSIFSYTQSSETDLEYDIIGKGPSGRYQLLYRREGNTRTDRAGPGILSTDGSVEGAMMLDPGLHRCEIKVRDASGNMSSAGMFLMVHRLPEINVARKLEAADEVIVSSADPDGGDVSGRLHQSIDGGASWDEVILERIGRFDRGRVSGSANAVFRYTVRDDEGGSVSRIFGGPEPRTEADMSFCDMSFSAAEEGVRVDLSFDRAQVVSPVLARLGAGRADTLAIHRTGLLMYSSLARLDLLEPGLNFFSLHGMDFRGYPVRSVKGARVLLFRSGDGYEVDLCDSIDCVLEAVSVRRQAVCLIEEQPAPGPYPAGLRAVSSPFAVEFLSWPFRRPLRLVCSADRRTGLFRWDEDKGWKCAGVPATENGAVPLNRPGVYVFLSDGLPPDISHVAIDASHAGSGFFKPYNLHLPVAEDGCGIDPWSAEAFLDGRRMVCEWDEFRERLSIPVPAFIEPGHVKLRVEVSDRAGNRTVEEFGFVLE